MLLLVKITWVNPELIVSLIATQNVSQRLILLIISYSCPLFQNCTLFMPLKLSIILSISLIQNSIFNILFLFIKVRFKLEIPTYIIV